jgi:hypothetical protein
MRTLANYLASLSTKTNTNGTEKLTALDGSALVGVPNQSYQVVDTLAELPASIPVGVQILTRDSGTMWRGLVTGESSLPAGTPWPVKGYKEFSGVFRTSPDIEFRIFNVFVNDIEWVFVHNETDNLYERTSGPNETNYTVVGYSDIIATAGELSINATDTLFGLIDNSEGDYIATVLRMTYRIYPPAPTP